MAGAEATLSGDSELLPNDSVGEFERDAVAAGLAPPRRRRFSRNHALIALGLTVVIIAAAWEVGYVTGWINPNHPVNTGPQLAGPKDCPSNNGGVSLAIGLESNSSTSLPSVLESLAGTFTNESGSCLAVGTSEAGFANLTSYGVASLVGPETPLTANLGTLANQTFTVPLLGSPLVLVYNLGNATVSLNLSASAVAGMYLGTVRAWNATPVENSNPGLKTSQPVVPFYFSGWSAANALLTAYLSDWNDSFRSSVGAVGSGPWPAGQIVTSPAAMLSAVAANPGSIGFEAADVCSHLPAEVQCASVQSSATTFTLPTVPSVLAAINCSANTSGPLTGNWTTVTGVSFDNASVYPMVEFTYAVVYHDLGTTYGTRLTLTQATWLLTLFWWVETFETTGFQGNSFGPLVGQYGYVPMPLSVAGKAQTMLSEVAYNGTSVLFPTGEENGETGNETGEF